MYHSDFKSEFCRAFRNFLNGTEGETISEVFDRITPVLREETGKHEATIGIQFSGSTLLYVKRNFEVDGSLGTNHPNFQLLKEYMTDAISNPRSMHVIFN